MLFSYIRCSTETQYVDVFFNEFACRSRDTHMHSCTHICPRTHIHARTPTQTQTFHTSSHAPTHMHKQKKTKQKKERQQVNEAFASILFAFSSSLVNFGIRCFESEKIYCILYFDHLVILFHKKVIKILLVCTM